MILVRNEDKFWGFDEAKALRESITTTTRCVGFSCGLEGSQKGYCARSSLRTVLRGRPEALIWTSTSFGFLRVVKERCITLLLPICWVLVRLVHVVGQSGREIGNLLEREI